MAFLGRIAMSLAPMLGRVAGKAGGLLGKKGGEMARPLLQKADVAIKPLLGKVDDIAKPLLSKAGSSFAFKPFYLQKTSGLRRFANKPATTSGAGVGGTQPSASPAMAGITPTTQMGTPAQEGGVGGLLKQVGIGLGTMLAFDTLFGG